MSPEQIWAVLVDLRTDIFSLGVMLYEMARRQRPFKGQSSVGLASRFFATHRGHSTRLG